MKLETPWIELSNQNGANGGFCLGVVTALGGGAPPWLCGAYLAWAKSEGMVEEVTALSSDQKVVTALARQCTTMAWR